MSALNEFPKNAQQQILHYLEADNFRAAKELYDYFLLTTHGIIPSVASDFHEVPADENL